MSQNGALRIYLLGCFRAALGARDVGETAWRLRKAKTLVKLLALSPGHRLHREQVLEVLWPELDAAAAANNLKQALLAARRALAGEERRAGQGGITLSNDLLELRPAGTLWVDVDEFRAAASAARETRDPSTYDRALALYAGDLLPEDAYEDWTAEPREELRRAQRRLLAERASLHEAGGDLAAAVELFERAVAADPTDEGAHRELMRLLARSGQRARALRHYGLVREALRRELDAEPDPATTQLYEELRVDTGGRAPPVSPPQPDAPPSAAPPPAADTAQPGPHARRKAAFEDLPAGTVTFLFTDIEGSTALLESDRGAYRSALARHHAILWDAIERRGGHVFETVGDAFYAVFLRAGDAAEAALEAQLALRAEPWEALGGSRPVRVRMGIHTGEVEKEGQRYFGRALFRCARIMAAAHGGQVLASAVTADLVRDGLPAGAQLTELGTYRLKGLAHPERLYQLLHADLPGEFPALQTAGDVPTNLPQQLTSFVGRERDVAEVERLLKESRLLTLTGPGGTGKTRLAQEVAAGVLGAYGDGVWLVELAQLRDHELVPQAIAGALGVRDEPGRSTAESIRRHLRDKRLLLMLDNFEHVLPAAPLVTDLLRSSPGVTVLATSRAPLRVYGEGTFPVPPLAAPALGTPLRDRADEAARYPSVRLFVERARAAQPSFALTAQNAAAVAEICQRLDGLPLAIELAAARVPLLAPHALLQRLERRLPLLTGGARDLPARQQTLRNAIAWSYDLLAPEDQILFARLSVFAGGCSLEAVEAVCAAAGQREEQPLDALMGLGSLVEKSLVRQDASAEGVTRFELLETLREYAWERLQERPEVGDVRRRHAAYYVALAEEAEPQLLGSQQAPWLDRLEREHGNLRAALQWALASGAPETGARLGGALWRFWFLRGHAREGLHWLEEVLGASSDVPPPVRARALNGAGSLARTLGDYARAETLHRECLDVRRRLGRTRDVAASLNNLGTVAYDRGDPGQARALLEESLALHRELGDPWPLGSLLSNLGMVAKAQEDLDGAAAYLEESLALRRATGDKWSIAVSLGNLAEIRHAQGDLENAAALCREGLECYRELGHTRGIATVLTELAKLASARGAHARAARLHGAAAAQRNAAGVLIAPAELPAYERALGEARAALGEDAFDAAWAAGEALPADDAIAEALGA